MTDRTQVHSLQVATELHRFINEQVLPGTGVAPEAFWKGFDAIVNDLAPRNAALLAERDRRRPSWTPGKRPIPAPSPTWPATSSS
jgi:malate synthase